MFYYILIIVWVFDFFFYANTEVFLIFSIFSCFFIFFFLVLIVYLDYLNELVVSENYKIYTKLYVLKYKFNFILNCISGPSGVIDDTQVYIKDDRYEEFCDLKMHASIFFKTCFYILLRKFHFINYLKFFKFVKTSLVNIYKLEFFSIKNRIYSNFSASFYGKLNDRSEFLSINGNFDSFFSRHNEFTVVRCFNESSFVDHFWFMLLANLPIFWLEIILFGIDILLFFESIQVGLLG